MSSLTGSTVIFIPGALNTLTGNSGGPISPTAGNINILGAGSLTVTGAGSTLTISDSGGGVAWVEVLGATQALAINVGYIMNRGTLITATLPAVAAQGSVIEIVGKGVGGWKIAQNAGQTIHFGVADSTTGAGGFVASTLTYDCIALVCITANTDWVIYNSVGNITVS